MSKKLTVIVVTVVAMVALTAGIVIAGDIPSNSVGGQVTHQQVIYSTNDRPMTAGAKWRPVRGLNSFYAFPDSGSPRGILVSADMRTGAAKVRIRDQFGTAAMPGRPQFAGPGSNAYLFFFPQSTGADHLSIEWRRAGDGPARATSFTAQILGAYGL